MRTREEIIAREEQRMRAIASRHVREEHIDRVLLDLAVAIRDDVIENPGDDDEAIAKWMGARVAREPRICRRWGLS